MTIRAASRDRAGSGVRLWSLACYLSALCLDTAGVHTDKVLPRPLVYFIRIACLFPRATSDRIIWPAASNSTGPFGVFIWRHW